MKNRKLFYAKIIYTIAIGFVLCQTQETLLGKILTFIAIGVLIQFGFSVFKTLWKL